jgi:predicted nucleotidyltransferase
MLNYKTEYKKIIEILSESIRNHYGDRLISLAIFGSVAKNKFRPDSDIDILIIASNLPQGRYYRVKEFMDNVENKLDTFFSALYKKEIYPYLSPLIYEIKDLERIKHLFFDMTEDVIILYDKEDFLLDYIAKIKKRLEELGSKKIYKDGGYYWLLKPDYKWGDIIEL